MKLLKHVSMLVVLSVFSIAAAEASQILSFTGTLDPNDSNSTFVLQFSIFHTTTFSVQSYGYGGSSATITGTNGAGQVIPSGGFDTYLSLFTGWGPTATFLNSDDDGTCPPAATDQGNCFDSRLTEVALAAGQYTLILSVTNNYSLAENYGTGTLGDGFTNLAQDNYYDPYTGVNRTPNYALDISTPEGAGPTVVPEPTTYGIAGTGLVFLVIRKRHYSSSSDKKVSLPSRSI